MMHELMNILLPIGKYLLAAALMLVFYRLVFKDRSSYNESRFYLTSIVLVSILVSQFKVVVYTPPTRIVEVEALNTVLSSVPASLSQTSASKADFMDFWNPTNLLLALYVLVTLILFISLLGQYVQIYKLKKNGTVEIINGYSIIVNPAVPTPFSFGRNIFIGSELTGEKREMIVQHESWHIKHRHFVDVLLMEILVRLFWFNPIVWMVRNELRSVHEFQTDRSVLQEGYDLFHYQTIILEEVMGNHSCLANGFNQSFTKKRFIMMKNTNPFRFSTLRQVALIPFLVAVFCLLSFTKGQGQIQYVEKTTMVSDTVSKTFTLKKTAATTTADTFQFIKNSLKFDMNIPGGISEDSVQKSLNDASRQLGVATIALKKLADCTDFTNKGLEIGALLKQLDVSMYGSKVDENIFLNTEFLNKLNQSDLQQALMHFTELKKTVDQLRVSKASLNERVSGFKQVVYGLLQDDFMNKVMELAIMSKSSYKTESTSTSTCDLSGGPLKSFKIKAELLADGTVRLTRLEGEGFKVLTYTNPFKSQLIDEGGMVSKGEDKPSEFRFEIVKLENGLKMIGIRGMAWSELSSSTTYGRCTLVFNQFGAVD